MKRICIFLEQDLIPKRYKENIERFLYSLNKSYEIIIYSPNIDLKKNHKNGTYIRNITINGCVTYKLATYSDTFDILILFSDYNKNLCFDRRPFIINSMKAKKTLIIPTHNILSYISLNEINDSNILYITDCFTKKLLSDVSLNCKSIFDNMNYDKKYINSFYDKYNIDHKYNIIAFIPGPLNLWYLDNYTYNELHDQNIILGDFFLQNLKKMKKKMKKKNYYLLGVKHYNDIVNNYNNINIKWIDDIDYNLLKFVCSGIITIVNIDLFKYINLNKPIIEIANIPFKYYFEINKIKNCKEIFDFFIKESMNNKPSFISKKDIPDICDYMDYLINNNTSHIHNYHHLPTLTNYINKCYEKTPITNSIPNPIPIPINKINCHY
jgi:hypothetical protein